MTRIAVISDLHFGSVPEGLADALAVTLQSANLDVLVVAGDLTMRARRVELDAAREWLAALPFDCLVVPGNHDRPSYQLIERFITPLRRFESIVPEHQRDAIWRDDCLIFGLDTTSSWQPHLRWQEGRVRRRDAQGLARRLVDAPTNRLRIVVAHHPFAAVPGMERARPARRAPTTLDLFRACHVDIVVSGHVHQSYLMPIAHAQGTLLALGARTALSDRRRGEPNGFWLMEVDSDPSGPSELRLMLMLWNGRGFAVSRAASVPIIGGRLDADALAERAVPAEPVPRQVT